MGNISIRPKFVGFLLLLTRYSAVWLNTFTFLQTLKSRLGTIIQGQFDAADSILYTDSYVARHRSRIRGILSAATRYILVMS